jgi:4-hydroxy-3-methylbut-2-en-1-yl diphosphate reductase
MNVEVIVAKHSGFCFGVKKAMERAQHELITNQPSNHPVYSLGPLIHNRQVVNSLAEKGLVTIESLDEAESGTIIIRSHGVPEHIYRAVENLPLTLVDTTCPFVKRIQTIVQEHHQKGVTIVIVGNASHPEVIGINGWCDNQGIVVSSTDDLKKIPSDRPLCVVAQTTMPNKLFEEISEKLTGRQQNVHLFNTICLATQERQEAAYELAQQVDAMIVIGGLHSSNTQKLADVCRTILPEQTYQVEQQSDLPLGTLSTFNTIGVSAGASTPGNIIKEIVETIESIDTQKYYQIAVDGPAGAGKSTIAKRIADKLNFTYIDTGAMYRALTYKALIQQFDLKDAQSVINMVENTEIELNNDRIWLDGSDITLEIRSRQVTSGVSIIAGMKEVREAMVQMQQELSKNRHVVMDGRDIGTVVLSHADLKIFLTATVEERAKRRFEEMKEAQKITLEEIKQQIASRDFEDENRKHDPLIPAEDAVHIDTTSLSINEVVEKILHLFCEKIKQKANK